MKEKVKYVSRTYRMTDKMAETIEKRAKYKSMNNTAYIQYLVRQDLESDHIYGTGVMYRLDDLKDKMDNLKMQMDEFGNLFLEFLAIYLKETDFPDFQELINQEEKDDSGLNKMIKYHLVRFMKAKKNFLGNIFEGYIKADEDIGREELQFRVLEQTKAQLKNLHKENSNDARI